MEEEKIVSEEQVTPEVKKVVVEKKIRRRRRNPIKMVINLIIWVVILVWIALTMSDFVRVQDNKEPKFCLSKETLTYEDGTVDLCTGLGYKVYDYKRTSYTAVEFGPFWINNRSERK